MTSSETKMEYRLLGSIFIVCLFFQCVSGNSEYDLKKKLFKRYNPTAIPVKNSSLPVQASFDLALRNIGVLDEKQQILEATFWIRIRWKDEFLIWNPKDYAGVKTINVQSTDIWVPDIVLYNSADSTGTGRVYKVMKTQVSIKHDGSVNWFCPLILKSECSVKLYNFPFDRQSCPLIFGLWTLSQLEVNITLVRKTGDIGSYLKNGVFVLTGMPAYTSTKYYTCCPNVPYTRMIYTIKLQRKTTFYLFNFIFPGGLLIILSFLSYLLPPESGERMGLGITNVIAFLFYMMLINEKIPPVSIAVPIITEFLLIAIAINAVTLISSAFAVKMLFFEGDNLKSVPWTVRVLINKHLGGLLARLCLMCGRDTDCRTSVKVTRTTGGDFTDIELRDPRLIVDSPESQSSVRRRRASHSPSEEMATAKSDPESRPVSNGYHVMKNQSGDVATGASKDHAVAGPTHGGVANGLHASQMPPDEISTTADKNPAVRWLFHGERMDSVCAGLGNVVKKIRENEASSDYKAEWRTAIKIIDRSLCVVLMLFTFSTMLYLYLSIEKFLVV